MAALLERRCGQTRPKFDENTESEAVPTPIRLWSPSKSHQLPCADVVASLGVLAPLRIDQSFASGSVGSGYFEVPFGGSTGTGTYTVGVAEMEDDYSASIDTTGTVEVGGTVTGQSQYEIDRDWFAVELTAGETYKVELLETRAKGGTLPQPYIWGIHDADGHLISGTSDYASGPHRDSQVFFTPDEDGTYYVAAGNHESGSLADDLGTYTLQSLLQNS